MTSGKSPYQRGNSARRGRGKLLVITVIVLLIGAAAWIAVYPHAVVTSDPNTNVQTVDPAAM